MVIYETIWFVALSMTAALLVHEGGHLALAFATGLKPRVLMLGVGPVLFRLRRPSFLLVLRALPVTGHVLVEPTDRHWAWIAMVAAGPLANLVALVVCLRAHHVRPESGLAVALAVYQGLFVIATLCPSRGRIAGITMASDGLQLYRLLRSKPCPSIASQYAAILAEVAPPGSPPAPVTRHAARLLFELGRADQFGDAGMRQDAFDSLRALLETGDLTPAERALVLCALCGRYVVYGVGRVGEADVDAWSREALALSAEPLARDTRGGVLLVTGRWREAEELIRSAHDGYAERHGPDSPLAAICRALLARAMDASGRVGEARRCWQEVEDDPAFAANPLLREIATRIRTRALPAERPPADAVAAPDQ